MSRPSRKVPPSRNLPEPHEEFEPACAECCRPQLFDRRTGKRLSPEGARARAVYQAWDSAPLEERQAFHRVTLGRPRVHDLDHVRVLSERIAKATGSAIAVAAESEEPMTNGKEIP